jgi:hypothetical protein
MKTSTKLALGTVLWAAMFLQPAAALAQGTAFTYQGRLEQAGAPAHGLHDLRFTVHDAASGGNQWGPALTNAPVAVSNGLFTVTLDFGFGVFNGGARWLEIGVRSNGTASAFTPLAPRQAVLPSPYAFWAANASQAVTLSGTVPATDLNGLCSNPVTFNNAGNSFTGTFNGNGAGLSNVNAATFGDPGAGGMRLMRLGHSGNRVIAGTLSQGSDRAIKQDFAAVNPREILDQVVALPVRSWAYIHDASRRLLGPAAQDFHAAFGLGADETSIATVDADGLALAAIQGLHAKVDVGQRNAEE